MALTHRIYEGLCREITTGKLKPGELLSRRQIAQRYGASYTPVIEALVRLENTGLVESEASQVARVRRVSIETIRDNYMLREAYESQAVRLACERATPEEIDELYQLADKADAQRTRRNQTGKDDDRQGPLVHWQFHRRIAEISRCPALVRELDRIQLLQQLEAIWFFVPNADNTPRYHSLLVDPIAKRDPQAADAAMRAHIRKGLAKHIMGFGFQLEG